MCVCKNSAHQMIQRSEIEIAKSAVRLTLMPK
jgi:hypothetical protein